MVYMIHNIHRMDHLMVHRMDHLLDHLMDRLMDHQFIHRIDHHIIRAAAILAVIHLVAIHLV